jgi:hypothetical protein
MSGASPHQTVNILNLTVPVALMTVCQWSFPAVYGIIFVLPITQIKKISNLVTIIESVYRNN